MKSFSRPASTTEWDWLVPFTGRNQSGCAVQNFLCRSGNVYVMDNHRAALWCWLQQLDLEKSHSLIHIDRHSDALGSRMEQWLEHLPDWSAGIDDYLNKSYRADFDEDYPTMRWDNYISIYLHEFGKNLKTFHCLTHGDGDKPNFSRVMCDALWDLPENVQRHRL